jgi:uncharacterized membrane protein YfcA
VTDCLDCDGYFSTDALQGLCFDRKLLNGTENPDPSYLWRDIIAIIVWFVVAGVAVACGVGGGAIFVPLGMLLLHFAPKPSSGLSQSSIFGATLGGLLLNIQDKHPFMIKVEKGKTPNDADIMSSVPSTAKVPERNEETHYYQRPLIDYDMALFLAPLDMAGAVLGVLVQKILPNWLYLIFAAIILAFTAYKTYGKFVDTRNGEKAAREQETQVQEEVQPQQKELELTDRHPAATNDSSSSSSSSCRSSNEEEPNTDVKNESEQFDQHLFDKDKLARCQFLLEQDSNQYPEDKIFALLILWIGIILLTFLKGGKGVESLVGITCTSPWYYVLIVIQFLWAFGFASFFGYKILKATEEKVAVGYPFHQQDVKWEAPKIRFFAIFTFTVGFVAGLVGISSGYFLGPLILLNGVHPRVSSATTATMIVLTSSSVAILFVTSGLVPWQYAVTFFCVTFSGALVGKTQIDGYVKRTGKASLLVMLLTIILVLATMGCFSTIFTTLSSAGWCLSGFNKYCSVSADHSEEDVCQIDRMLFGTP